MASKRYLTIDCGNSGTKYVVREGGEIAGGAATAALSGETVSALSGGIPFDAVIIGSVARADADEIEAVSRYAGRLIVMTGDTPVPIGVDYGSRSTLGVDRVAAAAGAVALFGRRPMLVVDAGTALTVDYVDAGGIFRGGNISPGLTMQLEALHRFTARLPEVIRPDDPDEWDGRVIGTDTASAMMLGAIVSMAGAVEYCRRRLDEHSLTVLTGGSAPLLARHIDGDVRLCPGLVDEGLYRILLYNENN